MICFTGWLLGGPVSVVIYTSTFECTGYINLKHEYPRLSSRHRNMRDVIHAGHEDLQLFFVQYSLIKSAPFSATIMTGAFVLPLTSVGIIEASTTLNPLMP